MQQLCVRQRRVLVVLVALFLQLRLDHVTLPVVGAVEAPDAVDELCGRILVTNKGPVDYDLLQGLADSYSSIIEMKQMGNLHTLRYAPAHAVKGPDSPFARPRPPLMYCWIQKNACSMFKMLFLRFILSDSEWAKWPTTFNQTLFKGAHREVPFVTQRQLAVARSTVNELLATQLEGPPAEFTANSSDRIVPGLVVTRNPYVRLLSAYLDKVANHSHHDLKNYTWQMSLLKGHGFDSPPTFPAWVRRMWEIGPVNINRHFKPQSYFCGMKDGVRFKYQIKLETLAVTYPCLVHQLGLGPWIDSQWSDVFPGRECFYKPSSDLPCSWWRDALMAATASSSGNSSSGQGVAGGAAAWYAKGSVAPHKTNAMEQLSKYYTREAIRYADELYADDFRLFGYQKWAGPPRPIIVD